MPEEAWEEEEVVAVVAAKGCPVAADEKGVEEVGGSAASARAKAAVDMDRVALVGKVA